MHIKKINKSLIVLKCSLVVYLDFWLLHVSSSNQGILIIFVWEKNNWTNVVEMSKQTQKCKVICGGGELQEVLKSGIGLNFWRLCVHTLVFLCPEKLWNSHDCPGKHSSGIQLYLPGSPHEGSICGLVPWEDIFFIILFFPFASFSTFLLTSPPSSISVAFVFSHIIPLFHISIATVYQELGVGQQFTQVSPSQLQRC